RFFPPLSLPFSSPSSLSPLFFFFFPPLPLLSLPSSLLLSPSFSLSLFFFPLFFFSFFFLLFFLFSSSLFPSSPLFLSF
ncbi:hypothetical protein ACXWR7_13045, partial [Streptococcus pyogenes]